MSYTAPRPIFYGSAINTHGPWWTCIDTRSAPTSLAWPTSDLAIYVPVIVPAPVVVKKLGIGVGAASGNFDIGIYDAGGTRLVSAGITAVSTTADRIVDVTDTTLGPGLFYFAVVCDNTTVTVIASAPAAPVPTAFGVLTEQLGAGAALPATATFAILQTLAYIPVVAALLETTPT